MPKLMNFKTTPLITCEITANWLFVSNSMDSVKFIGSQIQNWIPRIEINFLCASVAFDKSSFPPPFCLWCVLCDTTTSFKLMTWLSLLCVLSALQTRMWEDFFPPPGWLPINPPAYQVVTTRANVSLTLDNTPIKNNWPQIVCRFWSKFGNQKHWQ